MFRYPFNPQPKPTCRRGPWSIRDCWLHYPPRGVIPAIQGYKDTRIPVNQRPPWFQPLRRPVLWPIVWTCTLRCRIHSPFMSPLVKVINYPLWGMKQCTCMIPSLKLTARLPLKMDAWKMNFLLGPGLFSGARSC